MSDRPNQVFRPDITDYGMPPQNRLAQFLPYGAPQVWPASNPVGTETTQSMQSATPTDQIAFMRPDGTPVMASDLAAAHQQVQTAMQVAPTMVLGMEGGPPGIRAFHGSPYDFERFDTSKIGTGEGAQAYGHGLYMAGAEDTARSYRENLSNPDLFVDGKKVGEIGALGDDAVGHAALMLATNPGPAAAKEAVQQSMSMRQAGNYGYHQADGNRILKAIDDMAGANVEISPGGKMYEVNIGADPQQVLPWGQTVGQPPPAVRDKLLDMGYGDTDRGADVYSHMARGKEGDAGASQRLLDAGIPGIRYLDQGSRGAGQGTHNTVVFDANTIDILRKYGLAGLGIGLGTAATGGTQQPEQ